jgi:hypothetical protein
MNARLHYFSEEARETNAGGKVRIQLDLTEDQRGAVREALGMDGKTMEFAIEPLEERVTPIIAVLIGFSPK